MNKNIEVLERTQAHELLDALFKNLIEYRPLPWSLEPDWTLEIVDKNKQTIIKIPDQNREKAQRIVDIANSFLIINSDLSEDSDMNEYGASMGMGF